MLRRGEHPPGALKLVDAAETLHPGGVDEVLLRCVAGHAARTAGLKQGVDLFNSGRYWDAHEAWEHVWMPDRKGPDAGFYKGLIQVAAGCLHYGRRNRRGAVNKWRSGADYLRPYVPAHLGVRLSPLVASVDAYLEALKPHEWPELTMPRIVYE